MHLAGGWERWDWGAAPTRPAASRAPGGQRGWGGWGGVLAAAPAWLCDGWAALSLPQFPSLGNMENEPGGPECPGASGRGRGCHCITDAAAQGRRVSHAESYTWTPPSQMGKRRL